MIKKILTLNNINNTKQYIVIKMHNKKKYEGNKINKTKIK